MQRGLFRVRKPIRNDTENKRQSVVDLISRAVPIRQVYLAMVIKRTKNRSRRMRQSRSTICLCNRFLRVLLITSFIRRKKYRSSCNDYSKRFVLLSLSDAKTVWPAAAHAKSLCICVYPTFAVVLIMKGKLSQKRQSW
jgi:hypothetical protein